MHNIYWQLSVSCSTPTC